MSTMTKVFVVLNAVLSIALSCFFVAAAAQWDNWKSLADTYRTQREAEFLHRANLQASMEAALAMKTDALEATNRALAEAQGRNQTLTNDLAKLQSEFARARNEAVGFEAGRTKLQETLTLAMGELQGARKRESDLLAQNIDLQTRNAKLNGRVLQLTGEVSVMTDQVRNLQEKLFAAERVARGEPARAVTTPVSVPAPTPERVVAAAPAVAGPIHAEVIAVDGSYASLNVGESSGVSAGMPFMIWREGVGYVAELIVDRVRPGECGGKLQFVKGEVRKGDPASYGLENN
ncbi:MAG: hypothetical protein AB7Q17_04515 [Phycisphaerae bacterium]